jgi:hypothetical protein
MRTYVRNALAGDPQPSAGADLSRRQRLQDQPAPRPRTHDRDGHIAQLARTPKVRISSDAGYPRIIGETDALLRRCFPHNRVGRGC